jgi:hypothetical protein
MSYKMRRYMIAFWIFLTLSVSHFALAAPVAAGEIVEVRSNPVQVLNDGIATWEKRMGPNDKDQSSTNDVQLPDGGAPGGVKEGVDAEGVKEKGVPGWKWPWKLEELGSNTKGPDASPNNPPKDDSDGGGNGNVNNDRGGGVSAENMSPGPQSEHPTNPIMAILNKWIKGGGRGGPRIFY